MPSAKLYEIGSTGYVASAKKIMDSPVLWHAHVKLSSGKMLIIEGTGYGETEGQAVAAAMNNVQHKKDPHGRY